MWYSLKRAKLLVLTHFSVRHLSNLKWDSRENRTYILCAGVRLVTGSSEPRRRRSSRRWWAAGRRRPTAAGWGRTGWRWDSVQTHQQTRITSCPNSVAKLYWFKGLLLYKQITNSSLIPLYSLWNSMEIKLFLSLRFTTRWVPFYFLLLYTLSSTG